MIAMIPPYGGGPLLGLPVVVQPPTSKETLRDQTPRRGQDVGTPRARGIPGGNGAPTQTNTPSLLAYLPPAPPSPKHTENTAG